PEPPPNKRHELGKRAAVVYYLCRNHHLEHPHFMEVPLASPQGLYLRDVISRLDALRGNGMAAKYSWRYKNGFVWHDLSVDDLLQPAQGNEYVLKGSELQLDHSKPLLPLPETASDHQQNSSPSNARVHLHMPTRQRQSPRSPGSNQGWTSTSPSPTTDPAVSVIKEAVRPPPPQPALLSSPTASTIEDGEQCRTPHPGSSGSSSPKTSMPSSGTSSPSLNSPAALHDAGTQTRSDDVKLQQGQRAARVPPERPEIVGESHSKHPPAAGYHRRRSGTLQSLIMAEAAGRRRVVLEDNEKTTSSSISGKLKPANLLMRLMACGPNHPSFDLTSYKPLTPLESPSSPELFPLGALKPGTTSASTVIVSETENSNCSLYDSGSGKLKRSTSALNHQDGYVCQSPWASSICTILPHCRICEEASSKGDSVNLSRSTSKRMSDLSSGKVHSSRVVSFQDEKEKAVKIEDRQVL
ncbi:hypothetical protein BRADI_4g38822v3, partial [Brachypodium distachyon]